MHEYLDLSQLDAEELNIRSFLSESLNSDHPGSVTTQGQEDSKRYIMACASAVCITWLF